jgi:hypothetical protein
MALTPLPGGRAGYVYGQVSNTTSGQQFTSDRKFSVTEIRFLLTGSAIDAETIKLEAEGQSWFGGQAVPIALLQTPIAANNNAAGTAGLIIFRPETPILWDKNFPIKLTPSATIDIVIVGTPVM